MHEQPLKILVIDDEPVMRALFESLLEELDHEIACVENGDEGVALFKKSLDAGEPFDLIFIDLLTEGGFTGIDTLNAMMELSPDVYAIACSGFLQNMGPDDLIRYGFKGFLSKPFDFDELEKMCKNVCMCQNTLL